MTQATHLRSLQALELAVRTGSLKAAAEELHITPAAVGQRIKLLEDYLGVDLLARGRSGIRPANALGPALPHLAAAFREIETAAQLLDYQRVHELHVVADTDWAELWLLPRLDGFRQAHPNIRFNVNGLGDVPMRLGQADCEIWLGPAQGSGREDVLFRDYLVPVCSAEIAQRTSVLPAENRLEGYPLLHLDCYKNDPDAIGWPGWIGRFGHRSTAPGRGIRYRRIAQALEAVYSGAGFLVCGMTLVAAAVERGQLSLPFPLEQGVWTGYAYRLRFRENALRRAPAQRFREWLLAEAAGSEARLRSTLAG